MSTKGEPHVRSLILYRKDMARARNENILSPSPAPGHVQLRRTPRGELGNPLDRQTAN